MTALAGCLVAEVGPPDGAGTLRYRDEVFSSISTTSNLTYGSAPRLDGQPVVLKLEVHQPTGDAATARPAIVYVHGGGFSSGTRLEGASLMAPMVRRGFVVVSISYRLLAPAGCDGSFTGTACSGAAYAAMDDARAAVRWERVAGGRRWLTDPVWWSRSSCHASPPAAPRPRSIHIPPPNARGVR